MGYYIVEADVAAFDLVFRGTAGSPPPSDEETALVTELERTLRGLRTIFEGRVGELTLHFNNLANLARAGLSGPQAQPAFASRMLTEFRAGILEREAGPKKNRYMYTLGVACLRAGVPALVVGITALLLGNPGSAATRLDAGAMKFTANFALLLAACAAGVWVSFGARKAQFTFEDLSVPEGDHLYPMSRLAFAGILTSALALLFHSGAAQVSIGTMTTSDVLKSPIVALIVGFLCGFSEQVLAKTLSAQALRIVGPRS